MDLTTAIGIIAAAAVTVLGTALAARPTWSSGRKRLVSSIAALVLGVVAAVATGKVVGVPQPWIDGLGHVLVSVAGVIALAQGFHRQWAGALDKLAATTSPKVFPTDEDAVSAGPDDATVSSAGPADPPEHAELDEKE